MKTFFFVILYSIGAHAKWVSVVPALTEVIYEVGAGDKVVGVSSFCQYPLEACQKVSVGTPFTPDLERIVKLSPELVFTQKMKENKFSQQLRKLKIKLIEFPLNSYNDVLFAIDKIAKLANKNGERVRSRIKVSEKRLLTLKKEGTFLALISTKEQSGRVISMMAAGEDTYLSEIIALSGVKNWLKKSRGYKEVNMVDYIRSPADVIFLFDDKEKKREFLGIKRTPIKINPLTSLIPGPRVNLFMDELYESLKR